MTRIRTTIRIDEPAETLFEYVTTPGNWPAWHPSSLGVSGATDHSLEPGEMVTEEYSVAGRRGRVVWTVRERAAPHRWIIDGAVEGGGGGTITYTLTPDAGGTLFERDFVYAMPNALLALLDRLVLRRRVEAESAEALRRLKGAREEDGTKTPGKRDEPAGSFRGGDEGLTSYPLLQAMIERRSRRFGDGMSLNGGPLAYESSRSPRPLSLEEEAALAFAGCGITGPVLADLPFESGEAHEAGGPIIMINLVGRTVASGDAVHSVTLFVINDEGAWMLRRPQDYPRTEVSDLASSAREHRFAELYERSRVRIADGRPDVPRELPFAMPFNKWSANLPGTTYFLPVNEFTAFYINILLSAFSEEFGYFFVDERNRFKPPGIARFARSRGGHLRDDPGEGRFATVGFLETWLYEFAAIEQGEMLQNLALMTEALGLGGFPHFAAHPFVWFQTLRFRMEEIPFSRTIGAGRIMKRLIKASGKDLPVPTAVGLERDGETLIKPYCPPYYRNMEEAVLAFVDYKYGEGSGTLCDGGAATGWRDGRGVQAGIPRYSDEAIAATIAYSSYVYERYGRFPANSGPFRTVLAHQAHHLDPDFYDQYYSPGALTEPQSAAHQHGERT